MSIRSLLFISSLALCQGMFGTEAAVEYVGKGERCVAMAKNMKNEILWRAESALEIFHTRCSPILMDQINGLPNELCTIIMDYGKPMKPQNEWPTLAQLLDNSVTSKMLEKMQDDIYYTGRLKLYDRWSKFEKANFPYADYERRMESNGLNYPVTDKKVQRDEATKHAQMAVESYQKPFAGSLGKHIVKCLWGHALCMSYDQYIANAFYSAKTSIILSPELAKKALIAVLMLDGDEPEPQTQVPFVSVMAQRSDFPAVITDTPLVEQVDVEVPAAPEPNTATTSSQ